MSTMQPPSGVPHDGEHAAIDDDAGCGVCGGLFATLPEEAEARGMGRRKFLKGMAGAAAAVGAASAFPARALADTGDTSDVARLQQAGTLVLEPSWTLAYVNDDVQLLRDHSVVVSGGLIAEIVPGRIRGSNTRIPMDGQLLIPGMISGHTHVAMATPTRGIIESGRNFGIPALQMFNLSDDDMDALNAYNTAELLRSGCTTHVAQELDLRQVKSYVKVARDWAVRAYPGGMVPNFKTVVDIRGRTNDDVLFNSVPGTLAEIQANLDYGLTINGAEGGRILPQIAPQGPETGTPETMRAAYEAAVQLGNGIHTHLSTTAPDVNHIKRLWGKSPVEWIDEFGWYDVPLMAAHMSAWEGPSDAAFLADKPNFRHVFCPSGAGVGGGNESSNPYIDMLGLGLPTSVGLDSHSSDLLEQAKMSVLYGRVRYALFNATSPLPLKRPTVWDMIKSVTLYPAQGLHRDDLGRIAVGAKADLTSIDVSRFLVGVGATPPEPLNNLLYSSGLNVLNVMTEGVIQVRHGNLVVDDERRIIERGGAAVKKVWAELERIGWFTPTPR